MAISYERNERHSDSWHPGKSRTLFPRWSWAVAHELLSTSEQVGKAHFAVLEGMVFKAHEHAPCRRHGHPIWLERCATMVGKTIG